MRALPERTSRSLALMLFLVTVVALVAALQYRWAGQLTEDRREILHTRLRESAAAIQRAFFFELLELASAFRSGPGPGGMPEEPEEALAQRYLRWKRTTPHPELAEALFLRSVDQRGLAGFRRLDESRGVFREESFDPTLSRVVETCDASLPSPGPPRMGWPAFFAWRLAALDQQVFLLRSLPGRPWEEHPPRHLALRLNSGYFWRTLVPELTERAFARGPEPEFDVAVVRDTGGGKIDPVYDPRGAFQQGRQPDVRLSMRANPVPPQPRGDPQAGPPPGPFPRDGRPPSLSACGEAEQWEIWIRHRSGSVEEGVRQYRYRNLAASAAVLLLLSASIVLLLAATQRAQRLAKLRMDFAAGVSHELRTPLTVIRSAADNLADGAVTEPASVREHALLIVRESRRLTEMIEETLQFPALQAGRKPVRLVPVDVAEVVEDALRQTESLRREAGMALDKNLPPALPKAAADPVLLSRCIQNLLTNAVKYARSGGWIGIRAEPGNASAPRSVVLSVMDKGPGVKPEELPYIFDPFFQGEGESGVKGAGVGLGLSLAKQMMEAMGGGISVESRPGQGACFTLRLLCAQENEQAHPVG